MQHLFSFSNKKKTYLLLLILVFFSLSFQASNVVAHASTHQASSLSLDQTCLVPCSEIVNGGPPPDGIPPIENPKFYSVDDASDDLSDKDLVLAVEFDGQMYVYPHNILDWHEIVNQKIDGAIQSITYCPLTGTGIPFHSREGGLGTSGKLYENNLVFYDRDTETYWSQMYGLAITGERIGEQKEFGEIIQTTFNAIKSMYPSALVLSRDTGYTRDYDNYPYERYDYLYSETILFPSKYKRGGNPYDLYHPKTWTLIIQLEDNYGLIAYPELINTNPVTITPNNRSISVFFDSTNRLAIPFEGMLNGESLLFKPVKGQDEYTNHFNLQIYEDQFGNIWNMKGEAIDGPDAGHQLNRVISYSGFWFAATSFFGGAFIYLNGQFDKSSDPGQTTEDDESGNDIITTSFDIPENTGSFTEDNKLNVKLGSVVFLVILIHFLNKRKKGPSN